MNAHLHAKRLLSLSSELADLLICLKAAAYFTSNKSNIYSTSRLQIPIQNLNTVPASFSMFCYTIIGKLVTVYHIVNAMLTIYVIWNRQIVFVCNYLLHSNDLPYSLTFARLAALAQLSTEANIVFFYYNFFISFSYTWQLAELSIAFTSI